MLNDINDKQSKDLQLDVWNQAKRIINIFQVWRKELKNKRYTTLSKNGLEIKNAKGILIEESFLKTKHYILHAT